MLRRLTATAALLLATANSAWAAPIQNMRPDYIVTYNLSDGLESPRFTLTEMGFRLLPDYIKTSSSLPLGALNEGNIITIRSAKPSLRYCEKTRAFCWPTAIELDGTYARFTAYNGTKRYALDTSNLHQVLWRAYIETTQKEQ